MASVISSLETALSTLSQEAGHKFPQLHEVSNYALDRISSSRQTFVDAAEACARCEENETNLEDLAMPFLCALNTANIPAKITLVALTAIQTQLAADILDSNVRRNVMNALLLHEKATDSKIHVKILQTLPLLLTPKLVAVNEQILADAVGICCRFYSQGSVLAGAGIKQIVTLIFGKVESELLDGGVDEPQPNSGTSFGVGHVVESKMPLSENAKSAISFLLELVTVAQRQVGVSPNSPVAGIIPTTNMKETSTSEHQGWLSQAPITPSLALELIDSILAGHASLLTSTKTAHTFGQVIQNNVAPLVINLQAQNRNRNQKNDIKHVVQVLRFVVMLLSDYKQLLSDSHIHAMISCLLDTVDDMVTLGNVPSQLPYWKRAATLEALSCICVRASTLQSIYQSCSSYRRQSASSAQTLDEESDSLFRRLVDAVCSFLVISLAPNTPGTNPIDIDDITERVNSKLASPVRGIQLLSDSASLPVDIPIEVAVLHAAECVASIIDDLATTFKPESDSLVFGSRYANGNLVGSEVSKQDGNNVDSSPAEHRHSAPAVIVKAGQLRKRRQTATARTTDAPLVFNAQQPVAVDNSLSTKMTNHESTTSCFEEVDEEIAKGMVLEAWYPLLGALRTLLETCNEENMVQFILKAYMSITNTCGALDLVDVRDSYIQSLCYFTLPNWKSDSALKVEESGVEAHRLSVKHLQALKALFNIAHGLGAILGTSWHMVLETFQQLDFLIYCAAKANKNISGFGSSGQSLSVGLTESQRTNGNGNGTMDSTSWSRRMMEDEIKIVASMLSSIFESSRYLDDGAVVNLATALTQLSFTILANKETINVNPSSQSNGGGGPRGNTSAIGSTLGGTARGVLSALGLSFPDPAAKALSGVSKGGSTPGQRFHVDLTPPTAGARSSSNGGTSASDAEALARMTYRMPPFALEKLVETTVLNCFRVHILWDMTQSLLATVANKRDPELRKYGVQSLERIITKALLYRDNAADLNFVQNDSNSSALPANRRGEYPPTLEHERMLLEPLVQLVQSSYSDTREEAMLGLIRLVSSTGDVITQTWVPIVNSLLTVVSSQDESMNSHLPTAFKLTELLLENHFIRLPFECQSCIIQCVRLFAQQEVHVNLSLTAVQTMFFAICDHLDRNTTTENSSALWYAVFQELTILALDDRPEVRNSALSTLCSVVKAGGQHMDAQMWRTVMMDMLLPLLQSIQQKASSASQHKEMIKGEKLGRSGNSRMLVHHTRDTLEKQWLETKENALKGITNVVKVCFVAMCSEDWFQTIWLTFVDILKDTFRSRVSKRVSIACVRALHELASAVCVGAREHLSQTRKVVNGALVAVDASGKPVKKLQDDAIPLALSDLDQQDSEERYWLPIRDVLVHISDFGSVGGDNQCTSDANQSPPSPYEMDLATEIASTMGDLYQYSNKAFLRRSDAAMLTIKLLAKLIQGFPMKLDGLLTTIQRSSLHAMVSLPPLPDESWSYLLKTIHTYNTAPESSLAFARRSKEAFANLVAHAPSSQRFTIVEDSVKSLHTELLQCEERSNESIASTENKHNVDGASTVANNNEVSFLLDVLHAGMSNMVPIDKVNELGGRYRVIWATIMDCVQLTMKPMYPLQVRRKIIDVACTQIISSMNAISQISQLLDDSIIGNFEGILRQCFDGVAVSEIWNRESNLCLASLEYLFQLLQASFSVNQFSTRSVSLSKSYLERFKVVTNSYLELDQELRAVRLSGEQESQQDVQALAGASVSSLLKLFTQASVCNSEFGSELYPLLCQLVTVDDISVRAALREALLKYYVVSAEES